MVLYLPFTNAPQDNITDTKWNTWLSQSYWTTPDAYSIKPLT